MKKLFAIMLIAGSMVACNDSANGTDNRQDSIDSAASEVKDRLDNTGASSTVTDSAANIIDSSAEAKKDSTGTAQ